MTAIISIFLVLIASLAAYFGAERRGRPAGKWAAITLLLSPALFVLEFLRKLPSSGKSRWYAIPLEVTGICSLILLYSTIAYDYQQRGVLRGPPLCGSSAVISSVKSVYSTWQAGKSSSLSIVDIKNVIELSASRSERACSAKVILNNTSEHDASIKVTQGGDDWLAHISFAE